ncbi:hypothetical protein CERSUDRAFT_117521 [Gelatoporia subvermispora B]|uniref:Mid2 domain-containing protein n=1 Tax=Ceriporiopsis subvermispora (strain B) TaxID=914234 RepID=M2R6T2_CERS8|nr:hypothetical protein CERSUDRAFT_117521 [Gelatoporia subvermispora B]
MLRSLSLSPSRALFLLVAASCFLVFFASPHYDLLGTNDRAPSIARRQIFPFGPGTDTGTGTGSSSGSSTGSSTGSGTSGASSGTSGSASATSGSSAPATSSSSAPATPTSSNTPTPTVPPGSSSSSAPPTSSSPPTSSPPTDTASSTSFTTALSTALSTNAQGGVQTITYTVTTPVDTPSASASQSAAADQSGNSSKGVSTSTIVGLSVAGGVALIGIVAFVVWKFSKKRFSDDFDDSEAIKWPELNTHGDNPHALPTTRTGGAGFDTASELNLPRPESRAGSTTGTATSTVDLLSVQHDPYAVPPLPHLNPGVSPYRDDPNAPPGVYYDPYSGPVPHTLDGPGAEAIPMTQIGRARSPAPPQYPSYNDGRMSPAPSQFNHQAARARSPGPQAMYGGRVSPGPQVAYGPGPAGYGP